MPKVTKPELTYNSLTLRQRFSVSKILVGFNSVHVLSLVNFGSEVDDVMTTENIIESQISM